MKTKTVACENSDSGGGPGKRVGRLLIAGAVLLAISYLGGCGKLGAERYDVKGKVTYRGQPVPSGYVQLAPDSRKGNSGPTPKVDISQGNYEATGGNGVVGGPHVITIFGTDSAGKRLFSLYQTEVDLPKQSSTHDIEVPADR